MYQIYSDAFTQRDEIETAILNAQKSIRLHLEVVVYQCYYAVVYLGILNFIPLISTNIFLCVIHLHLGTVFPQIVSALEQFPPLNSFCTFMYCHQRSQYIRPSSKKNSFRGNYSRKYGIPRKAIWRLAIQQNWCFGQFYHSKIEK